MTNWVFFLFNLQTGNFSIRASSVLTVPLLMVLGCIIFTGPTTYLSIWRASSHAHMKELIRKWVIPSKNKTKQLQKMISNTDNTFLKSLIVICLPLWGWVICGRYLIAPSLPACCVNSLIGHCFNWATYPKHFPVIFQGVNNVSFFIFQFLGIFF